jgi:cytochrome c-type biogenesis protein CcmH
MSNLSRRGFLGRLGAVALLPMQGQNPLQGQDPLAGKGKLGTLRDPAAAGRPRAPTEIADYDERIKAIEHRLACSCGCTLDIFTCRTTDFTCTYSPQLHREVVDLDRAGKTAQEILGAFVQKYGEKALMAPKPEGFNLWGYLLPGSAILVAGGALVAVLSRRSRVPLGRSLAGARDEAGDPGPNSPHRQGEEAKSEVAPASPEEMERLRRALAEVED